MSTEAEGRFAVVVCASSGIAPSTELFVRVEALVAGKERVVGGSLKNKVQAAASGLIPGRAKAEMHRKMAEPGSAKEAES